MENVELVNIDLTSVIQQTETLTENIEDLETATKKLREEMKKEEGQTEESIENRKQLNRQIQENVADLKDLRKQRNDNIKLLKSENNSIGQLQERNKQLRSEQKKLNLATEEGRTRLREINDELDANNQFIKDNSDSLAKQKQNIGEYSSGLQETNGILAEMSGQLTAATGAGGGLIDSLKGFLTNPYVAVFAALGAAIGAITSALKNSRSASVLMQKATTGLSSNVDVVKKQFREELELVTTGNGAFKEATKQRWNVIKSIISGEKSLKDLNEIRKQEVQGIKDLKNQLIDLNDAYIDIENELQLQIVTNQGLGQVQAAVADDATRSLQERRKAAQEAAKFDEEALQAAVKLAQERVNIAEKEIELGIKVGDLRREADGTIKSLTKDGIELEKTYTEATVALVQADNELTLSRIENRKRLAEINQDDFEQELDFLLDIADAQKTVNEQQIADTRIALGERQAILKETQSLIEDSYNDQIDLFERELGVQLERNKISELNNKEIFEYARGLELSEIATNRLREVIVERRKAVNDLTIAERDLNEEELTRREEALKTVSEYNKQQLILQAEGLEAQKELRISWENEEFERRKAQEGLLNEELAAIEVEHLANLKTINDEYRTDQEKKDEEAAKKRKDLFKNIFDNASRTISDFFTFQSEVQEASLELQLAQAAGNEAKQEEIRRNYAKKKKRSAISQAIANGALAIIKAFSDLGPVAGAIASAFIIGTTGTQISRIQAEEFKNGGEVRFGTFSGPSHNAGGINLYTDTGQHVANVQGDEGFYVVNKEDNPAAVASLSAINSVHGKPFAPRSYMQDGGEANINASGGITFEQALALAEARPIQVSVVDIIDGQAIQATVEENAIL